MIVRMIWEFDVDNTWGETPEQCIEMAKTEFKTLNVDDFDFECCPEEQSIYNRGDV